MAIKRYEIKVQIEGNKNLNLLTNQFMRMVKNFNVSIGNSRMRVIEIKNKGQMNDVINGSKFKNFNVNSKKENTDKIPECQIMDDDIQEVKKKLKTIKAETKEEGVE